MSEYRYTCARAQKDLVDLVKLLEGADVIQGLPDHDLLRTRISTCVPCRGNKKSKYCCGWNTEIERGVLSFGPLTHSASKQIRLDLSAKCDYRRPKPDRQPAWDEAPLAASVVTIEIMSVETEELLERYHLDLANSVVPPQPGPVWHLQVGGNPAGDLAATPTSWLDEPRWPVAPMDLSLAIEFLVYSFFPEKWEALNEDGEWVRLMKDAEQLAVSHFADQMKRHFQRDAESRDRTWLSAQDNKSRAYDPRPPVA
jgi:hypothetical protein